MRPQSSGSAPLQCQECGKRPAFTAVYTYLVCFSLIMYRSRVTPKVHCEDHLFKHGLRCYLLTVLLGGWGIGIVPYPFFLRINAKTLRPIVGGWWYLMVIVPTLIMIAVLVLLLSTAGKRH